MSTGRGSTLAPSAWTEKVSGTDYVPAWAARGDEASYRPIKKRFLHL